MILSDENIFKEVANNTCFWREKYKVMLEHTNTSSLCRLRSDSIIRGFASCLKSIEDIDKIVISETAKISTNIVKATLHDFVNFVKQQN